MVKVWGIKNCQSVKKALEFLEKNHIVYEFIDYKKNPPTYEELQEWVLQAGMQKVLNSKGRTYKELGIKDQNLDEREKIEMMCQNPTLIKRPVLQWKQKYWFGFDKEVYEKIL